MPHKQQEAIIVSHIRLNREWCLTFNRSRVNLVEVVDRVLDDLEAESGLKNFVLHGQCAVLEDYLEVAPHQRFRIAKLIEDGRLAVGPWYILPDEFLVSGEATVRNLLFGKKVTADFGSVQKVGYLPDSFGHLAQMPQILNLAGIDSFFFTRGMGHKADDPGWLFCWQAPDGSEVLAINQGVDFYNVNELEFSDSCPVLLNNGCNQFSGQQNFATVLKDLSEAHPEISFKQGRYEDFLKAARHLSPDNERPLHQGELLGGRDHFILSGVWSARMYLKQENERCQNLLCRYVEPLHCQTHFMHGDNYPAGLIDTAWQELLRNHPHHSIGGCSTDSVHKDMETRFAAVHQTSDQLLSRLGHRLSPTFAPQEKDNRTTIITVANSLPIARDEIIERLVILQPLSYNLDNLRLLNEQGAEVPFRIVDRWFVERFEGIDYRSEIFCPDQLNLFDIYLDKFADRFVGSENDQNEKDCFLHIQFMAANLPALGHSQFRLTDEAGESVAPVPIPVIASLEDDQARLENNLISVLLHSDGTFDLTDKITGRVFPGLNLLEDTEDAGDEFDYSPAPIGGTHFSGGLEGNVRLLDTTSLQACAEAKFRLNLPRSLERNRKNRQKRNARCDVRVRLIVRAESNQVDIETDFNNHAFDHRLRTWFPTGVITQTVVSDGHFLLNKRPLKRPTDATWKQPAPPTWPQQDFSVLSTDQGEANNRQGLAIFNRGLPEFETWSDDDGGAIFALTLLRCVDWLSRDDFPTRNSTNAGPILSTPDAQCYGRHTFNYSVAPFSGNLLDAGIKDTSERYRTPPISHQGVSHQMRPGGHSLFEKTNSKVNITAIKKSENDDRLIIRLCNLSSEAVCEILNFELIVLDAFTVDLLEEPLIVDCVEPIITHGGSRIRISLDPYSILSIAVEFDREEDS